MLYTASRLPVSGLVCKCQEQHAQPRGARFCALLCGTAFSNRATSSLTSQGEACHRVQVPHAWGLQFNKQPNLQQEEYSLPASQFQMLALCMHPLQTPEPILNIINVKGNTGYVCSVSLVLPWFASFCCTLAAHQNISGYFCVCAQRCCQDLDLQLACESSSGCTRIYSNSGHATFCQ